MSKPNRTIPDLSSNVLKLSFMRPSLQAAEKAKVAKENENKLNITFDLPDRIRKLVEESYKSNKKIVPRDRQKNISVSMRLPRGLRVSYGGFNPVTEEQMRRKEINLTDYSDDAVSADEATISVSEMREFAQKNRKKHNIKKRRTDELEDGEISERKLKKKRTN